MKKTSKLVALLMAAVLAFAATACSNTPAASSQSSSTPESSVPESSSSAVLTAPDKEYVKGVTTDNEYVSEYWGIKFTAPNESIMLATEEQVAQLLGMGADAMGTDPTIAEAMKAQLESYELAAIDMTSGSSLMMLSTELPMSGITAELYIAGVVDSLKNSGENTTVTFDNDGNFFKETIAGKEFTCIGYTITSENIPDNHQCQRILLDGERALIINSSYPSAMESSKATLDSMIAAITAIE